MGLAALLCLLLVFTLYSNSFDFQRVNVGVSLGFCKVSDGFPEGFRMFPASFLGFRRVSCGFRRVSERFVRGFQSLCGFPWFLHGFLQGFPQRRFCAGFSICGRILKPQASKSWRIVITVIAQCCAKSDLFVGTISGARKAGNFATVLRGASTVAISVFCNLKNVLWKNLDGFLRSRSSSQFYRRGGPKIGSAWRL